MTIASDVASKVQALEAGAVDYLIKPFEAAELLARVNTHLSLYKLQEHLETLVHERTVALKAEIRQREQQQEEKEQLWQTIHQQNRQFRTLTQLFVENQERNDPYKPINQQYQQNVQLLGRLVEQLVTQLTREHKPYVQQIHEIVQHMEKQTETFTMALTQE